MKNAILRDGHALSPALAPAPSPAEEARPWNLRTRRAAYKAPPIDAARKRSRSPSPTTADLVPPPARAEFAVALSRKEVEEDYMAILGERPPPRPKKRPRNVQKQLDTLFPGLWLTEVSEDIYKVPDLPDPAKI